MLLVTCDKLKGLLEGLSLENRNLWKIFISFSRFQNACFSVRNRLIPLHSFCFVCHPNLLDSLFACCSSHSQQTNKELTEVFNQIWCLDTNRLRPGTDYIISLQVCTTSLPPLVLQNSRDTCKHANPTWKGVTEQCCVHSAMTSQRIQCS